MDRIVLASTQAPEPAAPNRRATRKVSATPAAAAASLVVRETSDPASAALRCPSVSRRLSEIMSVQLPCAEKLRSARYGSVKEQPQSGHPAALRANGGAAQSPYFPKIEETFHQSM